MRVVSYLRVSTARQGASGLGLEAQRAAVAAYIAAGPHTLATEYVEVESGGKASRPQLIAALAECRLHKATLLIAKLDRLARNVAFIANLMDGGVDFVACDMLQANRLTLHLLAAIAEHEREMISQRTRAALAAAKVRGVRLGNPRGGEVLAKACKKGATVSAAERKAKADQHTRAACPTIQEIVSSGVQGSRTIATALNQRGIPSPTGGIWYEEQVRRTRALLSI